MNVAGCPLCEAPGGALVWQGPKFRVIRAHEAGFPAFWRVVWAEHVAEFSQLDRGDRIACMDAVAAVETAVIDLLQPTKLNLASLGNQVAHLHWHVIARFEWDSRFPAPVWAPALREADEAKLAAVASRVAYVDMAIARALAAPSPFAAGGAGKVGMAGLNKETPSPTAITVHGQSRVLEVSFSDGAHFRIPFELMRVYSPSAEVQGHGPGQEVLQTGKREVGVIALEAVGNYAVQPTFSDGHDSGIFSWDYLYFLGSQQDQLWADYQARLEKAGVDRDAPMPEKAGHACGH